MGKPKYSECSVWIVISMLVGAIPVNVTAQPGFISILCGGKANHTDENNIQWVTDDNYIDGGQTASTGDASLSFYLQNQRFFPKPLKKACYQLPIASNVSYLFRAWFVAANNDSFQTMFTFSVETLGMLQKVEMAVDHYGIYYEFIFVSSGRMLYVCLTRTSENHDPFINAIELRSLRDGMYGQAKRGSLLSSIYRKDVGGDDTVR
eukprot:PITA_30077